MGKGRKSDKGNGKCKKGKGGKGGRSAKGATSGKGGKTGRSKPSRRLRPQIQQHLSDGYRPRDERTVVLGRLPPEVKTKDDVVEALEKAFNDVIEHIHVSSTFGYAFVHFSDEETAEAAIRVGSVDIMGTIVDVTEPNTLDTKQQEDFQDGDGEDEDEEDHDKEEQEDNLLESAEIEEEPSDDGRVVDKYAEGRSEPAGAHEEEKEEQEEEEPREEEPGNGGERDTVRDASSESFEDEMRSFVESVDIPSHGWTASKMDTVYRERFGKDYNWWRQLGFRSASHAFQSVPYCVALKPNARGTFFVVASKLGGTRSHHEPDERSYEPRDKGSKWWRDEAVPGDLSDGWKDLDERSVFVCNVPATVRSKQDVVDAFDRLRLPVVHVDIQPDRRYGFLHFKNEDDARNAVDQRVVDILGKRMEIRPNKRQTKRGHFEEHSDGAARKTPRHGEHRHRYGDGLPQGEADPPWRPRGSLPVGSRAENERKSALPWRSSERAGQSEPSNRSASLPSQHAADNDDGPKPTKASYME